MLAKLLFLALSLCASSGVGDDVRALWRCEPTAVEVGEPFALVLELTHPAGLAGRELAAGGLVLDGSWALLAELEPETTALADGAARTRKVWRVASLEPGERSLSDALAGFAHSQRITRIQIGEAQVQVAGILAEGEDEPRPLREFAPDFAPDASAAGGAAAWPWGALLGLAALAGGGLVWWRRQAARRGRPRVPGVLERLGELERGLEHGDGRESCYALTQLLREAGDRMRRQPRDGLSDEEWLAEVTAAHEIPRAAVAELGAVLERTRVVKYAGERPTPWALEEIFARARAALEGLGAGEARA